MNENSAPAVVDTAPAAPATPAAPETSPTSTTGVEGTEAAPEAPAEGTQNAEEGQAPEGSATSEESAPDTSVETLFEGVTVAKDTVDKLRSALGDTQAFELISQLDQVTELQTEFGGIPTAAEIQEMGQASQALAELYQNLETDPQKAVDFFLSGEEGKLDPLGAKFMTALADGVRKGTVPREARMVMASAVTASLLRDVEDAKRDYQQEIQYAESRGLEGKAEALKAEVFLMEEVGKFLRQYVKGGPAPEAKVSPEVEQLRRERDELAQRQQQQGQQEIEAFRREQQQYAAGLLSNVIDSYVNKLPSTLPASLREATQLAIKSKVEEAVRAGKDPSLNLAQGKFNEGHRALAAGDSKKAEALFTQAYALFKSGSAKLAAQLATPILNDVKVGVAEKSQAAAGGKLAAEQKTGVMPGAGTGAGAAEGSQQSLEKKPGETVQQYLARNKEMLDALARNMVR